MEENIKDDGFLGRLIYNGFIKNVPKNFPRITFCAEVKNTKGKPKHLLVKQDGKDFKFDYDIIEPYKNLDDLKILEDELFDKLSD